MFMSDVKQLDRVQQMVTKLIKVCSAFFDERLQELYLFILGMRKLRAIANSFLQLFKGQLQW